MSIIFWLVLGMMMSIVAVGLVREAFRQQDITDLEPLSDEWKAPE